jgi:hypothetical protein
VFTLKLYGDESADETRSRVFAVGAVFGTEDEWALAIREWLRRTRGRKFHANKVESEYARDPATQKHKDNLALYKDLTTILAESHIVGLSVALDLASLNRCLPGTPPETAYCKCFTDILRNTAEMARRLPGEESESTFEYVFDSRLETDGTASQIYQVYRKLPEWRDTAIFDSKVTFEGGDEPRLEMADLLAREAMKELDRQITGARPKPRRSYEALRDATMGGINKFIFINRDSDYCESWRDQVNGPQGQADRSAYEKWLIDTGNVQNGHAHDTQANRIRFYAWLERRDQRSVSTSADALT